MPIKSIKKSFRESPSAYPISPVAVRYTYGHKERQARELFHLFDLLRGGADEQIIKRTLDFNVSIGVYFKQLKEFSDAEAVIRS